MLAYPFFLWLDDKVEYILADQQKKEFMKKVPKSCRICVHLRSCRNERNEWKCIRGCLKLREFEFLTQTE